MKLVRDIVSIVISAGLYAKELKFANKILKEIPAKYRKGIKVKIEELPMADISYAKVSKKIIVSKHLLSKHLVHIRNRRKWEKKVGNKIATIEKTCYTTENLYGIVDLDMRDKFLQNSFAHEIGHHIWFHLLSDEIREKVAEKLLKLKVDTIVMRKYSSWIKEREEYYMEEHGGVPFFLKSRGLEEKFAEAFRLFITKKKYPNLFKNLKI